MGSLVRAQEREQKPPNVGWLFCFQMLIEPQIFSGHPVVAAQSNRLDGVSKAPFDSLNLGLSVHDDEQDVSGNRALFCGALGISTSQLAMSRQIHGDRILRVSGPLQAEGYDALVTNTPGVVVSVFVADCTPVLLYDPVHKACAAVHAGWRGTAAGIVAKTMATLHNEFGTFAADCLAYIGACIGAEAFEVGADVAGHFADDEKRYDPLKGKFFVDLKAANRHQLLDAGLPAGNIEVSPYCTVLNNDLFFSHRLEKGITGRMMAVIGLQAGT